MSEKSATPSMKVLVDQIIESGVLDPMPVRQLEIGGRYNWRNQPERLVYLGYNWSGNGFWHQFALADDKQRKVWCEILPSDLGSIEETKEGGAV